MIELTTDTPAPSRKRARKIVASTAVLVVGGGAAFAYWTNTGSGTGSGATGENNPVTVVQTSTVSAMAPGVDAQSLNGTFNNPNPGPVYIDRVTVAISSVTKADGTALTGCAADDYTIAGTAPVKAEVLANDTSTWTGLTIQFNNKATVNQDACKNAKVNLTYTAHAS